MQVCDFDYYLRIILKTCACVYISIVERFSLVFVCKSSKTTVMAAVFLIVPALYYKEVISSGVNKPWGGEGCFKKHWHVMTFPLRSLLQVWRKFSDALKTAAEVKGFRNSQQGFVQELGATECM